MDVHCYQHASLPSGIVYPLKILTLVWITKEASAELIQVGAKISKYRPSVSTEEDGSAPSTAELWRRLVSPGEQGRRRHSRLRSHSPRPGRGLRVPVGGPVAPPRPLVPAEMVPTDSQGQGCGDLPGAASRRAAATPGTGRRPGQRLRWPRRGQPWRPRGARDPGPRLRRRRSARRARSSTAARPRSAAAAVQNRRARPPPPPWSLKGGQAEHRSRLRLRRLHHSLRSSGLGLGRRHHRPHAPQLPRDRFLPARASPAPGLECCASAARHMETGAARTYPGLGWHHGPAPAPPRSTALSQVTNSASSLLREWSPASPALQNPKGQSHSHSASTLRERSIFSLPRKGNI